MSQYPHGVFGLGVVCVMILSQRSKDSSELRPRKSLGSWCSFPPLTWDRVTEGCTEVLVRDVCGVRLLVR